MNKGLIGAFGVAIIAAAGWYWTQGRTTEGPVSVTPARWVDAFTPAQAAIRTDGRLPLIAFTRAVTRR